MEIEKWLEKRSLGLGNISPVIIDVEARVAFIDLGAMHARSTIEKGIEFFNTKNEVPNSKPYWLVWVAIDHMDDHPHYAGVTACEMMVDRENRRGYKSLPTHVNFMDKSLKRQIIVNHMDLPSKKVLAEFLQNHNEELWDHSIDELKSSLSC